MSFVDEQLAIEGGPPVAETAVPYHRPSITEREKEATAETLESRYVVGPGPNCEEVEEELCERWKTARVLTTTSCTHALELALLTLDLKPGQEVVVPSFTYVSSALAVIRAGGTPVFADIDPDTLTLTRSTIEAARGSATRAVMMVHYGGFAGPVEKIQRYCQDEGLILVEDAAQAFDGLWKGRQAGTFGRFGALSFHGTKSITCGEGGALLVNREKDVRRAEMIRDKGTDRSSTCRGDVDRYTWRSTGSSYVLSDILGSILKTQVERWPQIKKKRLQVQQHLQDKIRGIDSENLFQFVEPPDEARTNGHITAFTLPGQHERDWLLEALQAEGIQVREHYHPLHLSPYARENLNPPEELPAAEQAAGTILRVPAYPDLSDRQQGQIIEAFEKVYPHLVRRFS